MTAIKTVDDFLSECDEAPSLLLAVDDEPTPRADVYKTFRSLGIFQNSPKELTTALEGVSDLLAPEMETITRSDGIILLQGYEEATEVGWELMQKGITPTVKVFDIRIEKEAKNPLNGVQARYDLADFDRAPVVYFTAFSSDYVGEKRLQAAAPVYLVEKGGAGTTERLRDVVTGLEQFGKIMSNLEAMLLRRNMVIEQLYEKRGEIEGKLGLKGKDESERETLEREFDRTAYSREGIDAIRAYQNPASETVDLRRMDLTPLTTYVEKEVLPKLEKGKNIGSYDPRDAYNLLVAKIIAKETMIDTMQDALTGLRTNLEEEGFGSEALRTLRTLKTEIEGQENAYEMQFADEWLGIEHVTTSYIKERVKVGAPEEARLNISSFGSTTYDPTKARVLAMGVTRYVVGIDRIARETGNTGEIVSVIDETGGDVNARVSMKFPEQTDPFVVTTGYQSSFALSMGDKILKSLDPQARITQQYNLETRTLEITCRVAGDKLI